MKKTVLFLEQASIISPSIVNELSGLAALSLVKDYTHVKCIEILVGLAFV